MAAGDGRVSGDGFRRRGPPVTGRARRLSVAWRSRPLDVGSANLLPIGEAADPWFLRGRDPVGVLGELLAGGRCGGAVVDGLAPGGESLIVGYAVFGITTHLPALPPGIPAPGDGDMYVAGLRVRSGWERRGIGSALATTVFREASRVRRAAVSATADRAWSETSPWLPCGFLEAVGFRLTRPHPVWPLYQADTPPPSLAHQLGVALEGFLRRVRRGTRPGLEPSYATPFPGTSGRPGGS